MLVSSNMFAAKTGGKGTVTDAQTGELLPFVQIYFLDAKGKSTTVGTTSDIDGKFSIYNNEGYKKLVFQMLGYRSDTVSFRDGQQKSSIQVKLYPDGFTLQDVVVKPQNQKQKYRRKGNPAVELIKNVIARKDSFSVRMEDHYIADTYTRMCIALDNFTPNYSKGLWKNATFLQKYTDTTGVTPSITLSMRENICHEYYQRSPRKEKKMVRYKHTFGIEDLFAQGAFQENLNAVFKDIDITEDNIELLFNRFVSPLSSSLAVMYYQYYIMDTIMVDGDKCIDLAFVPVNSESYSFTGHLYIMNDSTYKLKKYEINTPPNMNLNFLLRFKAEQTYRCDSAGMWSPYRCSTVAQFYVFNKKRTLSARQTKIYTGFDTETNYDTKVFSRMLPSDTITYTDTTSIREDLQKWEKLRPEPLSFYEGSVMDLLEELKQTPGLNAIIMTGDAMTSEFVVTTPSTKWGESKWDFGPIYNTISWNPLEGARLRIGGTSTANLHPNFFFQGYAAFGFSDLRPKYNATLIYSFNKKKYHPYEAPRHYLSVMAQYDVEEPGQLQGIVDRDHILMSIYTSKPALKNYQYVFRTNATYMKEWNNRLAIKASFDFENNEAAGAMSYNRVLSYTQGKVGLTQHLNDYNCYEGMIELRYSPGSNIPISRLGVESAFALEQNAPRFSLVHRMGFLDDRNSGGQGFYYNATDLTAEKRFWLSSFGHLDMRLQTGAIWNKVPFTKLYFPKTTQPSIYLGRNSFNLMYPMEFMMDWYVALYASYYLKGWIFNRIPGINKLKLRGVVSFAAIYGGLTDKNNPYVEGNEGLYVFPTNAEYNAQGDYESGYSISPMGVLPYMEVSAGIENIFKFLRIDYIRRITYNDYLLPDGIHRRKLGAWGRNGVKITLRFEF